LRQRYHFLVPKKSDELYRLLQEFLQRLFSLGESGAMDQMIELDVSFTQARTMFLLAHTDGPLPINEVAAKLGLSVAATGRNIDQLVKLGIVERQENPDDRRVKLVSLSPTGFEIADQQIEQKRRAVKAFVARLGTTEAENLTRALRPILAGESLRSTTKDQHVST
jgi:DNA-binding MarR family transcriptional regulator